MCVNFCLIKNLYVTMFFKKAIACKIVDIPPKEITAEDKIVLYERLKFKLLTERQPFVISKNRLSQKL